jgi:hypothetical protein
MNLRLSIGMASNPGTWSIFDGKVKPGGIDLIASRVHPSELFWRQPASSFDGDAEAARRYQSTTGWESGRRRARPSR